MRVEIDNESGFCFGVVNAISRAEECLGTGSGGDSSDGGSLGGGGLVSLGDIVHNGAEMARLEALGLEVAPEEADLSTLAGRRVLIRAHGEPPHTYRRAGECGIVLIDATCPVVARLQKTVADAHAEMSQVDGQVVIFGKRGHAEIKGLVGHATVALRRHRDFADSRVTVVENDADLDTLDFAKPIYFLAQTTSSLAEFRRLADEIRRRAADPARVMVHDTVCRQVSGREEHLAGFARRFDVVVFVAGAKSSNGRVLFEAVRAANPRAHKIENAEGLRREWFAGADSVGVCGATSTPRWLMEDVAGEIAKT